ncbi:MAG TPA: hypothetical protein VK149_00215 [Sideroxyarcus sp.]|nr:hypothetical protein [Sideroxyarcus sp.]
MPITKMDAQKIDDNKARQDLYAKTRDDLLKRQLSNSENADRAVLTVSAAALGFSLAFIKDVVPLSSAMYSILLYLSWLCFVLAIVITVASFFTSQHAIHSQLELAERYYLKHDEDALKIRPRLATITDKLNMVGAASFVVGILMTCAFVAINLGKETSMAENRLATNGATIPNMQRTPSGIIQKGANIPAMQPTPPQSGAPIPSMQKAPAPPPASTGNTTAKK